MQDSLWSNADLALKREKTELCSWTGLTGNTVKEHIVYASLVKYGFISCQQSWRAHTDQSVC